MRISDWSSDVCSSDLRNGKRGAGQWRRIGWDEALDEIADRLVAVRERYGAPALCAAVSNAFSSRGVSVALLMRAYGSPNWMMNQDLCGGCQIGRASWRDRVCQYV